MPTPLEKRLISASESGNLEILKHILGKPNEKVNVNCRDEFWLDTPLHKAANSESKNLEIVRLLLSSGSEVNAVNGSRETPLFLAVRNGFNEAVKLLLRRGADVAVVNKHGESVLFKALQLHRDEAVAFLLRYGCHMRGEIEDSLLGQQRRYFEFCKYAARGDIEVVELMISYTPDLDFRELGLTETPMHFAVMGGHLEVVRMMLNAGAKVQRIAKNALPYLHLATKTANLEIMKLMLDRGADVEDTYGEQQTALHWACRSKFFLGTQLLLDYGANINTSDSFGQTPLHLAFLEDEESPLGNPKLIKFLLKRGADPNALDAFHVSPLHYACLWGRKKSVKLLIKHDADASVSNYSGETPLHYAAKNHVSSEPLEYLLENRILDPNVTDHFGHTALHNVAQVEVTCEKFALLLKYGVNVNLTNKEGKLPKVSKSCAQHVCPTFFMLKKLKMIGQDIADEIFRVFRHSRKNRFSGLVPSLCKKEIDRLKKIAIGTYPRITMYDLLFVNRAKLCALAHNIVLTEIYEQNNGDFERQFSNFGFVLNQRYERTLERRRRLDLAKEKLSDIVGVSMSRICEENIFKYLSDEELERFEMDF